MGVPGRLSAEAQMQPSPLSSSGLSGDLFQPPLGQLPAVERETDKLSIYEPVLPAREVLLGL
jgi:hypothetical protein